MFTYDVEWHRSDVRWASRWDTYLAMSDVQIHWFSIINSVVVVFFLAGTCQLFIYLYFLGGNHLQVRRVDRFSFTMAPMT